MLHSRAQQVSAHYCMDQSEGGIRPSYGQEVTHLCILATLLALISYVNSFTTILPLSLSNNPHMWHLCVASVRGMVVGPLNMCLVGLPLKYSPAQHVTVHAY